MHPLGHVYLNAPHQIDDFPKGAGIDPHVAINLHITEVIGDGLGHESGATFHVGMVHFGHAIARNLHPGIAGNGDYPQSFVLGVHAHEEKRVGAVFKQILGARGGVQVFIDPHHQNVDGASDLVAKARLPQITQTRPTAAGLGQTGPRQDQRRSGPQQG